MPKDILITLPSKCSWSEYEKEIEAVRDGSQVMRFKMTRKPLLIEIGKSRCYVLHQGVIKGWMLITGFVENTIFTCSTTNKMWVGSFLERSGEFHRTNITGHTGFRGFRYFNQDQ